MKFTRGRLEQVIIELLDKGGLPHILKQDIPRECDGMCFTQIEKLVEGLI